MTMVRGLGAAVLVIAVLGAGCTTMSARDRIVTREASCGDVTAEIYFEPDSAEVTKEGRAVLRAAADQAKGCQVDKVLVMGLADAAGAPAANLELSKQRASSVTQALAATGLPAAEFDLSAAGQAGSTTTGGDNRPLRRRADVTLKLSTPRK
ncbi:MAG: OmpA family protein [Pseudomonadota bacterium]